MQIRQEEEKNDVRTLTIQREGNTKQQRKIAICWQQKYTNVRIYAGIGLEKKKIPSGSARTTDQFALYGAGASTAAPRRMVKEGSEDGGLFRRMRRSAVAHADGAS